MRDANPTYWEEYSNIQKVKHDLIKSYLGGWYPILTSWNGRVLYLDTHAGKGRYTSGADGSPLVAVNTLIQHTFKDRILNGSEVCFYFVEGNPDNVESLKNEVQSLGPLHKNIKIECSQGNCFELLEGLLNDLDSKGHNLAPAFIFVDPYGFKIPGSILKRLMKHPKVELFINVIWRELDMGMRQDENFKKTIDYIFEGEDWSHIPKINDFDERAHQTVELFRKLTDAKWATYIRMLGDNKKTRYMLVHLTNHDRGRELIKDCIWKVCPDGGYYAQKNVSVLQEQLIQPEPDLKPLETWVLQQLQIGPKRWSELHDLILNEQWRKTHVNKVVQGLNKSKKIKATDYVGRFGASNNPLLSLA